MLLKSKKRWYVGVRAGHPQVFVCYYEPTVKSHGKSYAAIVGPFDTMRGALWAAKYGQNNHHCQCVADVERLAKSAILPGKSVQGRLVDGLVEFVSDE